MYVNEQMHNGIENDKHHGLTKRFMTDDFYPGFRDNL